MTQDSVRTHLRIIQELFENHFQESVGISKNHIGITQESFKNHLRITENHLRITPESPRITSGPV